MKSFGIMVLVAVAGFVGSVNAAEVKTIKYFTSHVEEAHAIAKDCNVKEVECKNAKYVAWETRNMNKKNADKKEKSEPVKK